MYRCGSTSSEGTAKSEHVLQNKTFSNDDDTGLMGTMPNNGNWSKTIQAGTSLIIPKGFHAGNGVIQTVLSGDAIRLTNFSYQKDWETGDTNEYVATGIDFNYASVIIDTDGSGDRFAELTAYFYKNGNLVTSLQHRWGGGINAAFYRNMPFDAIYVKSRRGSAGKTRRTLNVWAFKL